MPHIFSQGAALFAYNRGRGLPISWHELSERRALRVVRMSAAALRNEPRPDQDAGLRERILALTHRHRRYGAGMIYLKLRQEGRVVNHKRVDRIFAEARLQVKRRRRKRCRSWTVSPCGGRNGATKCGRPVMTLSPFFTTAEK